MADSRAPLADADVDMVDNVQVDQPDLQGDADVSLTNGHDPEIVKSEEDKKAYRMVTLPNGLITLLIYDPEIAASGDDDEDDEEEDEEDEIESEESDEEMSVAEAGGSGDGTKSSGKGKGGKGEKGGKGGKSKGRKGASKGGKGGDDNEGEDSDWETASEEEEGEAEDAGTGGTEEKKAKVVGGKGDGQCKGGESGAAGGEKTGGEGKVGGKRKKVGGIRLGGGGLGRKGKSGEKSAGKGAVAGGAEEGEEGSEEEMESGEEEEEYEGYDEEDEDESDGDDDEDDDDDQPGAAKKLAAAAMCVGVGSFLDPPDALGLAHFLEHMLFMGSVKFPDENEYDSFLRRHGGGSNAFTETEFTCYHFDVAHKYLHPALDRFAQFFVAPLVKADAMEREVQAVDSEFNISLQSDVCRVQQLQCSTCFSSFCVHVHDLPPFPGPFSLPATLPAQSLTSAYRATCVGCSSCSAPRASHHFVSMYTTSLLSPAPSLYPPLSPPRVQHQLTERRVSGAAAAVLHVLLIILCPCTRPPSFPRPLLSTRHSPRPEFNISLQSDVCLVQQLQCSTCFSSFCVHVHDLPPFPGPFSLPAALPAQSSTSAYRATCVGLQSDVCRVQQLQCSTCVQPDHPFRKFSWGNRKSLIDDPAKLGVDMRERLLQLYSRFYTAGAMRLVVVGGEPLDTLESWVRQLFSPIPPGGSGIHPLLHQLPPPATFSSPSQDSEMLGPGAAGLEQEDGGTGEVVGGGNGSSAAAGAGGAAAADTGAVGAAAAGKKQLSLAWQQQVSLMWTLPCLHAEDPISLGTVRQVWEGRDPISLGTVRQVWEGRDPISLGTVRQVWEGRDPISLGTVRQVWEGRDPISLGTVRQVWEGRDPISLGTVRQVWEGRDPISLGTVRQVWEGRDPISLGTVRQVWEGRDPISLGTVRQVWEGRDPISLGTVRQVWEGRDPISLGTVRQVWEGRDPISLGTVRQVWEGRDPISLGTVRQVWEGRDPISLGTVRQVWEGRDPISLGTVRQVWEGRDPISLGTVRQVWEGRDPISLGTVRQVWEGRDPISLGTVRQVWEGRDPISLGTWQPAASARGVGDRVHSFSSSLLHHPLASSLITLSPPPSCITLSPPPSCITLSPPSCITLSPPPSSPSLLPPASPSHLLPHHPLSSLPHHPVFLTEGSGSLLSLLKAKGWATELAAGVGESGYEKSSLAFVFTVTITLSDDGLKHALDVVGTVFQYISMLRQAPPQRWVFEELQAIAAMDLRFAEEDSPDEYAVRLAALDLQFAEEDSPDEYAVRLGGRLRWVFEELQAIAAMDLLFAEEDSPDEYAEPQAIAAMDLRFAEEDSPDEYAVRLAGNMFCYPKRHVIAGDYIHDKHVIAGDYIHDKWDPDRIAYLLSLLSPHSVRLDLLTHSFDHTREGILKEPWFDVPYTTTLLSPALLDQWASDTWLNPDLRMPPPNDVPRVVREEAGRCKVWYKQDDVFRSPRLNAHFALSSPHACDSPRSAALTELAVKLIEDSLNETLYLASVAKLDTVMAVQGFKIEIRITGFSHKLPTLAARIFRHISTFRAAADRFSALKEERCRAYRNALLKPLKHSAYLRLLLLRTPAWTIPDKLSALTACEVDDLNAFLQTLFSRTCIEMLIHGNATVEDALALASAVTDTLPVPSPPLLDLPSERCLQLPRGKSLLVESPVGNPAEENSAVEVYYQACQDQGRASIRDRSLVDLLEQVMSEPLFDTLRTKEQLGYRVDCGTRLTHGVFGFCIRVQSADYGPEYLQQRVDSFLNTFRDNLSALPEADFRAHRAALQVLKMRKDHTLGDETHRYWEQIWEGSSLFNSRQLEAVALCNITLAELCAWFDRHISMTAGADSDGGDGADKDSIMVENGEAGAAEAGNGEAYKGDGDGGGKVLGRRVLVHVWGAGKWKERSEVSTGETGKDAVGKAEKAGKNGKGGEGQVVVEVGDIEKEKASLELFPVLKPVVVAA
ncbi:unnamed protein product [Closterium sp. Naga37s-1]|nr:unnamed protein product [Closterium sp. Naga37s-1]